MLPLAAEEFALMALEDFALFKGMGSGGLVASTLFGVTAGLMAQTSKQALLLGAGLGAGSSLLSHNTRNIGGIAMGTATSTTIGLITHTIKKNYFSKSEEHQNAIDSYYEHMYPQRVR